MAQSKLHIRLGIFRQHFVKWMNNKKTKKFFVKNHSRIYSPLHSQHVSECCHLEDYRISKLATPKTIYVCWLQGIENAPRIVQDCYSRLKNYSSEYQIVLVTEKNYQNYCHIPEIIIEKYRKGIISRIHFSDLLRTELLVENGGIWIDATAMLTGKVPESLAFSDLFMFSTKYFMHEKPYQFNSWFIISQLENRFLTILRDLLWKYWEENKVLLDYALWHLFGMLTSEIDREDAEKVICFPDENAHVLQKNFSNKYSPALWQTMNNLCFVQKLTYKTEKSVIEKKDSNYQACLRSMEGLYLGK